MYPVSDRFLETISGTHQAVVRALLLTDTPQFGAAPTGVELPILSGDVKLTSTADVKATLDITVPGDYWDVVQPFGAEIWVARGVAFGDGTEELVPLGYFRIDEIEQDPQPYGPVRISASDRIVSLQQNRVLFPFQVPEGYTHRQLFERLVNGRTAVISSAPPLQTQAAQLIHDRFQLGSPIFEDWTWADCPQVVNDYNDALLTLWRAEGGIPAQTMAAILIDYRILCHAPIFEDWTWADCPQLVADYNDPLLVLWEADGRPEPTVWLQDYATAHGGTMPVRTQAAGIIKARLESGLTIFEDWTWPDPPQIVGQHNDAIQALYPGAWNDRPTAIAWLAGYISSNGGGGSPDPVPWLEGYIAANGGNTAINTLGYAAFVRGPSVPIIWTSYDPDRAVITGGQVVEDSTCEFMAKLADTRNCVLRFDELGQLIVEPRDRDPDTPAVYEVAPGANGNLIRATRKVTRDAVYNIVTAYGSDPAAPTGYRVAYNQDPTSPLRWNGPFGPAPRYFASPLLRTADMARDAAAAVLSRYTGLPTTLGLWTVPNPALRPQDAISAKVTGLAENHLIDEVTIPLAIAGAGPVEIATKTTNLVIIPEQSDDPNTGGSGVPTAAQILQEKAFELTSTAENSTVQWWTQFGYIEDVGDGRGYTGGIAGFTSATGDMLEVVQQYVAAQPTNNVLAPFVPGLQACANVGMGGSATSTANAQLGTPFKTAWATAAGDPVWQTAQRNYRDQVYWLPAFNAAVADGVGNLGTALYYDTSINHGPGEPNSGDGSFDDIRSVALAAAGGSTSTFGKTSAGSSSSASSANKTVVSKFTATATGVVTAGHAHLWVSTGSADVQMVLYADSAGAPAALLGTSGTFTVSQTTDAAVRDFAWSAGPSVTNGTDYWIGFTWADPGTNSVNWGRDATAAAAQSNSSHGAATFGAATALTGPIAAWVTVTSSGGTPAAGGSEATWLGTWLTARSTVLTAWGDNPVDGRISMFTALVGTGNLTLTCPFSWSVYGDSYTMAADPLPYGWTGTGTGGETGQTNWPNPGVAHNIGSQPGQNSFNLGCGFDGTQPEQFSQYGSTHHDFGRDEIEAGLNISGFYEINAAGEVAMTSHPGGGKTSNNTSYSRVEYRELERDGKTKMAFNPSSGRHYVKGRSAADALSSQKPQMVLAQMHDSSDDTAMIYVNDSSHVIAKIRGNTVATLDSSYVLGTLKDWMIEVEDGTIKFYWDDLVTPKHTDSSAFSSTTAGQYFKVGSYMQWNLSNGDATLGKVRLASLEHWHSKTPLSSSPWPTPARPATGGGSTGSGGGTGTGGTSTSGDGVETAKLLGWGAVIDGDEFNYTGAPNSRWGMYDGPGHDGNGVRSPSAFNVANGILTCTGDNVNGGTTGGMSFSRSSKLWRVEWRVRVASINPSGGGNRYHAVLILWPTSDQWPQGGEDDFYECDAEDGAFTAYIHIPGNDGSAQHSFEKIRPLDLQNFHNIAYERTSSKVTCWIDGVQVFQITDSDIRVPGPLQPTMQLDNFFGSNMEPAVFQAQWFRIYAEPS